MLEKSYIKSRKIAKVKFVIPQEQLPKEIDIKTVYLVGDFNAWDTQATPMKRRRKDGAFYVSLDLEPGQHYTFRYLVNGEHWFNDWDADSYSTGAFEDENSVVNTPVS